MFCNLEATVCDLAAVPVKTCFSVFYCEALRGFKCD